jgi:hypothetical protein
MSHNALYFPYINVPNNAWFFRVLLYWDKVSSIVPSDYVYNPDLLEPFMRDLVAAELVEQVIPYQYISRIPEFNDAFLEYVNHQISEYKILQKRRARTRFPIHIEKMEGIASELVKLGLAQFSTYSWYEVDDWVANMFMNYLAAVLGKINAINADPVTDSLHRFSIGDFSSYRNPQFNSRMAIARQSILEKLFPLPVEKVDIPTLVEFKAINKDRLSKFRESMEKNCIQIANINDADGRSNYQEKIINEMQNDINEISEAMKSKWKRVTFGSLIPIIGAGIPTISALANNPMQVPIEATALTVGFSLASAVYQAIDGVQNFTNIVDKPLAYVAFARERLPIDRRM